MPTTFNVIFLGNLASIDTTEGNFTAENAASLVGQTFGAHGNALVNSIQSLSADGAGFSGGGAEYYDMDNATANDTFSIDGGPAQTFDGTSVYDATVTYVDGTTATLSAVVFQDTDGNTYLAPEFSANADQATLESGPIQSVSLNSVLGSTYSGMTGSRETFDFVTCFVSGTRLATSHGQVAVEHLSIGQKVLTRDNGLQPVRWIGQSTCAAFGRCQPVRIRAGSLATGIPERDLLVSQQHRMMINSPIAERMTGRAEVLIPAKKLLGCDGMALDGRKCAVTYYHILLDRHEIVFAEGAPTETLLTGPMARDVLGQDCFDEVSAVFPDILQRSSQPVRPVPKGHLAKSLVRRHAKNAKPFLS
ncbi:Hint domain-containing protein [Marivita sp. S6314]|uniref:Hint domain-containing protein n=1 Tax=Marivita sp. S6314 TaxID=2926406 RepID=UPI001FF22D00|nr:Hint domain-containing protein [Marivita sp. S6314]MCK0152014.1 Hint domain-containing protein [Marivita sp. S6314]